ncbi:MAG: hypothetical protein IPL53_03250 [Ignavibacteria bacterium]|nr:hypothetical protein [Ignavibacteria bacterium]
MKIIIILSVVSYIFGILNDVPAGFSFLIAGMIFIYSTLALLMFKYFATPEPAKKPLPLRILEK